MIPFLSLYGLEKRKRETARSLFTYGICLFALGFALGAMLAVYPWVAVGGYIIVGVLLAKFFRPWL